jgi:hypothetical protein
VAPRRADRANSAARASCRVLLLRRGRAGITPGPGRAYFDRMAGGIPARHLLVQIVRRVAALDHDRAAAKLDRAPLVDAAGVSKGAIAWGSRARRAEAARGEISKSCPVQMRLAALAARPSPAAAIKGWPSALPLARIDRLSPSTARGSRLRPDRALALTIIAAPAPSSWTRRRPTAPRARRRQAYSRP